MEDFIRALGAEPVIYPYRNECCGGYISLKEKQMAQNMCEKIMDSAKGFEADMLITACPLCKYNLCRNGNNSIPVYYFTELPVHFANTTFAETETTAFRFTILQSFLLRLSG